MAEDAAAELAKLRAAVAKHHAQKADDRCHLDDDELYAAAGLPPVDRRVGDKFEMIKNCTRFVERRCEGGGWPTYAELEAKVKELEARLGLAAAAAKAALAEWDATAQYEHLHCADGITVTAGNTQPADSSDDVITATAKLLGQDAGPESVVAMAEAASGEWVVPTPTNPAITGGGTKSDWAFLRSQFYDYLQDSLILTGDWTPRGLRIALSIRDLEPIGSETFTTISTLDLPGVQPPMTFK